ncbi:unnamed protein product [Vitrella brassicaformis CCMP3155]|uniref:Uncharacterized protein n=2 Tax=Vitrella brassicaformis TaxID=1169539 RepID=A0A0G4H6I2_VITBC|nr:unnamed protein product [Vitrella brassicaformis CCMP3155]|eukprot:CEM39326.1 unnamed protein product [Vitrella brassicaformis CCMP3155]
MAVFVCFESDRNGEGYASPLMVEEHIARQYNYLNALLDRPLDHDHGTSSREDDSNDSLGSLHDRAMTVTVRRQVVSRDIATVVLQQPPAIVKAMTKANTLDALVAIDFLDLEEAKREGLLKAIARKVVRCRWCEDHRFAAALLESIHPYTLIARLVSDHTELVAHLAPSLLRAPHVVKRQWARASDAVEANDTAMECVAGLVDELTRQLGGGTLDASKEELVAFLTNTTGAATIEKAVDDVFADGVFGVRPGRFTDHSFTDEEGPVAIIYCQEGGLRIEAAALIDREDQEEGYNIYEPVDILDGEAPGIDSELRDVGSWWVSARAQSDMRPRCYFIEATFQVRHAAVADEPEEEECKGQSADRCVVPPPTTLHKREGIAIETRGENDLATFGVALLGANLGMAFCAHNLTPEQLTANGVDDKQVRDVTVSIRVTSYPLCDMALMYLEKCIVGRTWRDVADLARHLPRGVSEHLMLHLSGITLQPYAVMSHWLASLEPTRLDAWTISKVADKMLVTQKMQQSIADLPPFIMAVTPHLDQQQTIVLKERFKESICGPAPGPAPPGMGFHPHHELQWRLEYLFNAFTRRDALMLTHSRPPHGRSGSEASEVLADERGGGNVCVCGVGEFGSAGALE